MADIQEGGNTPVLTTPPGDKGGKGGAPDGKGGPPAAQGGKDAQPSALQQQFNAAVEVIKQSSTFDGQAQKLLVNKDGKPVVDSFMRSIDGFKQLSQVIAQNDMTQTWTTLQSTVKSMEQITRDIINKQIKLEPHPVTDENGERIEMKEVEQKSALETYFTTINTVLTEMKKLADTAPSIAYNDLSTAFDIAKRTLEDSVTGLNILQKPLELLYSVIVEMADASGQYGIFVKMISPDDFFQKWKWDKKMEWTEEKVTGEDGIETTKMVQTVVKDQKTQQDLYELQQDGTAMSPLAYMEWVMTGVIGGINGISNLFSTIAENKLDGKTVKQVARNYSDMINMIGPALKQVSVAMEKSLVNNFGDLDTGVNAISRLAVVSEAMSKSFTNLDNIMKNTFQPQTLSSLIKTYFTIKAVTKLYSYAMDEMTTCLAGIYAKFEPQAEGAKEIQKAEEKVKEAGKTEELQNVDAAVQKAAEANEQPEKVEEVKAAEKVNTGAGPGGVWGHIDDMVKWIESFNKITTAYSSICTGLLQGASLMVPALMTIKIYKWFLKYGLVSLVEATVDANARINNYLIMGDGSGSGGGTSMKTVVAGFNTNILPILEPTAKLIEGLVGMFKAFAAIALYSIPAMIALKLCKTAMDGVVLWMKITIGGLWDWYDKMKKKHKEGFTAEGFNPLQPVLQIIYCMGLVLASTILFAVALIYGWKLIALGLVGFGLMLLALIGIVTVLNLIHDTGVLNTDGMKALLMFLASGILVILASLAIGLLMQAYGDTIVQGFIVFAVALVALGIIIFLANKLIPVSSTMEALACLILGIAVVFLIVVMVGVIYALGEFMADWSTLGRGFAVLGVGMAFLILIGAIAGAAVAVLPIAMAGLGMLLGCAVLLFGTVSLISMMMLEIKGLGELFKDATCTFDNNGKLTNVRCESIERGLAVFKLALGGVMDAIISSVTLKKGIKLMMCMPVILSLGAMAMALMPVVWLLKSLAKMEFYDEEKKQYVPITNADVINAMANLKTVITTVAETVIGIYNDHPELFSTDKDSPIGQAFDGCAKVGDLLYHTAMGLQKIQDIKMDKAVPAVQKFFSNFGKIVETALGLDVGEMVEQDRGWGVFGKIADAIVGKKKVAPIQEAMDAAKLAFSDENTQGVRNMFDIVGSWVEMEEKLNNKAKKQKDILGSFSTYAGLFKGPSKIDVMAWWSWSKAVDSVADGLRDIIDAFKVMSEGLNEQNEVLAKFCASVIKFVEDETGYAFQLEGSGGSGGAAASADSGKANSSNSAEMKKTLEELLSTAKAIQTKLNDKIKITNAFGEHIQVECR